MGCAEGITTEMAYIQFGNWLEEQPFWLQDAAWRIYTGKIIDDNQIKIYSDMCIDQFNGRQPSYHHLIKDELVRSNNGRKTSVISLSEIAGVNALSNNACLEFEEQGITAVYGLNGSGKSGYMRIFKELSSCPYEEPIQPNVFKKSSEQVPSCKVVASQDGILKEEVYNLSSRQKQSLLADCDVFDTRISNQYISSTNNVSYQPFVFTVLSELAAVAYRISKYIAVLKSSIPDTVIELPDELAVLSYMKWATEITKDSKIPAAYTQWGDEEEKALHEIPKLLDTESVKQRLATATSQKSAISFVLNDINDAIAIFDKESFDIAYQRVAETKEVFCSAQTLFGESADKHDKISINLEVWRTLWESAKKYYDAVFYAEAGVPFGEAGSTCPLCHQTINEDTHKRVYSVDQYINGTCRKEYLSARQAFQELCDILTKRKNTVETISASLETIFSNDDFQSIVSIYKRLHELETIKDEGLIYDSIKKIQFSQAMRILEAKLQMLNDEIEDLQTALKDDKKTILSDRLAQLNAHKWVYDNGELIQKAINSLQTLAILEGTKQYLTTNKITLESNKLADSLITQAYIDRFTRELSQLAPGIRVRLEKAPSQKGNSPYKVTIDTGEKKKYKPEDILSEGEQRIVALAAFFADATGREELAPIVIDDPISSLDLNFEDRATKRIVEIAKKRQVIVFTHRISLLVGLSETCSIQGVTMKEIHIRGTQNVKGISDFAETYHGNVKTQLGALKNKLSQIKKLDEDSLEYFDLIGRVCQQFRICIERSVEDVLLFGIVRRFHRNIRTNNMVSKLSGIEKEDCQVIDKMMTKYSYIEHSQPSEAVALQYSVNEIEADIESVINWIAVYNKKHNTPK